MSMVVSLRAISTCCALIMLAQPAAPQCVQSNWSGFVDGDNIAVRNDFAAPNTLLTNGINRLEGPCPTSGGEGFPNMTACACSSNINVDVQYIGGNSGANRCGQRTGTNTHHTVKIWDSATRNGQEVPCQPPGQILAHELGHVLGLKDSACGDQYIMSNHIGATVNPLECEEFDLNWRTPWEDTCHNECDCEPEACNSPILLDLDGGRLFSLTSVEEGVLFDIDGDGDLESVAWTATDTDAGFLCHDVDESGVIEGGNELIGEHYGPTSDLGFEHGFDVLTWYDDPVRGGNGDGVIGPDDAIFDELLIWIDHNQNGMSESAELFPLASLPIDFIETDYRVTRLQDEHGNVYRYISWYWMEPGEGQRRRRAIDVLFRTEELSGD